MIYFAVNGGLVRCVNHRTERSNNGAYGSMWWMFHLKSHKQHGHVAAESCDPPIEAGHFTKEKMIPVDLSEMAEFIAVVQLPGPLWVWFMSPRVGQRCGTNAPTH